jgi:elongation factor Ts
MAIIAAGIAEPDDNRKKMQPFANGYVASFVDEERKVGVMVEMNCQSEFVARSNQFQQLAQQIAHHIAEADPKFIGKEDVSSELAAKTKELFFAEAIEAGKSGVELEDFIETRLSAFWAKTCLLEQRLTGEPELTINDLIDRLAGELQDTISVRRFVRFQTG